MSSYDVRVEVLQFIVDGNVVRRRIFIWRRRRRSHHAEDLPPGHVPHVLLHTLAVYLQLVILEVVTQTEVKKYKLEVSVDINEELFY